MNRRAGELTKKPVRDPSSGRDPSKRGILLKLLVDIAAAASINGVDERLDDLLDLGLLVREVLLVSILVVLEPLDGVLNRLQGRLPVVLLHGGLVLVVQVRLAH